MEDRVRGGATLDSRSSVLNPPPIIPGFRPPVSWALYLAASWTWCIGMFLPVLLFRDYGIRGFLIFAVPNMIGAAAMGSVLHDAQSSARLVRAHGVACVAFSTVTLLFHLFFVLWVIRGLIGAPAIWITALLAIAMFGMAVRDSIARYLAAGVFVISLAAFALSLCLSRHPAPTANVFVSRPTTDLIGLAAVCTFGFALCPYLDLTFHRARQSSPGWQGSAAFGIGFLIFFPLMILFTLWYAPRLTPGRWELIPVAIAGLIAAHMMCQTALTVAFHARAIASHHQLTGPRWALSLAGIAIAVLACGLVGLPWVERGPQAGETVYRLFMFLYALPFPAYVWICMTPLRDPPSMLQTRRIVVFVVAVVLAAPLLWLAFFGSKMLLLAPAVGIVLLARLFNSPARSQSAA